MVDRRRLKLQWRAAVVAARAAVAAVAIAFLRPGPFAPEAWVVLGLMFAVALGVSLYSRPRPFAYVGSVYVRAPDREAAVRCVSAGHSVDPPALEAEALEVAHRNFWARTLSMGWWPLLGATLVLRPADTPVPVATVIGVTLAGSGLVLVSRARTRFHNLSKVEDRRTPQRPTGRKIGKSMI